MLQVMQYLLCPSLLLHMDKPDFRQALIRGQFACGTCEKLALHAGVDTLCDERVCP